MDEVGQERATQAGVAPVWSPSAGPSQGPLPERDRRAWLVAIPLALIVVYAFIPILANDFVDWDDHVNFLTNTHFRGLGAAQVRWAWTTTRLGVYQPLAWMLFEAQYVCCRFDPRGYHLTSLLLQVANAVVLYVLTVALLVRCRTDSCLESPWACFVSAGLATALFAVHPLRVEPVAWLSCQPYLPCALFSMLAVLAYLRAFPADSSPRWGWLAGSFLCFVAALLFHPVPVNLPAVFLILDIYPLRRFPDETGRWLGAAARRALLEKVPFVIVSLLFMGLAIAIRAQSRFLVEHYEASKGIAQACYAIWFYIEKTVLPLDLTATYLLPRELNWLAFPYSLSIVATLAVSAGLFLSRRRWPGLLAAWLCYLLILAPNSGIVRNNDMVIAGDRYSYIAMLGVVMPAAAGFCRLGRMASRWHRDADIVTIAIGLGVLVGLTALTRNQCRTWLDSQTLWAHALAHRGNSNFVAHNNLGNIVAKQGNTEAAMAHYTEALRSNPDFFDAHYNLGMILFREGRYTEAEAHFTAALRVSPGHTEAHNNLGMVLSRQGRYAEAEAHFTEAVRLNPSLVVALFNLGRVKADRAKYDEAAAQYAEVIRRQPGNVGAHQNLGNVLGRLGKYEEAAAHYAEAIRLDPGSAEAYNASAMLMAACPEARFRDGKRAVALATRACELAQWRDPRFLNTLAAAEAEAGDFDTAITSQKRAIEVLMDERGKDDYRSRLVLYQAKKPYRQR